MLFYKVRLLQLQGWTAGVSQPVGGPSSGERTEPSHLDFTRLWVHAYSTARPPLSAAVARELNTEASIPSSPSHLFSWSRIASLFSSMAVRGVLCVQQRSG